MKWPTGSIKGLTFFPVDTDGCQLATHVLLDQIRDRYPGSNLEVLDTGGGARKPQVERKGRDLSRVRVENGSVC